MAYVYIHSESEEIIRKTTPPDRKPGLWRRLLIIDSLDTFEDYFKQIYEEMGKYKAVGFDVECVNFKNAVTFPQLTQKGETPWHDSLPANLRLPIKIANGKRSRKDTSVLLQIATWSGFVFLIRLCYLERIPETLRRFLADSSILKLGVGIEVDSRRLWHDWGLHVRGWLDLRHICGDLGVEFREISFARMGLKTLATTLFGKPKELGLTPSKMKKISFSDWTARELTDDQLRYGAWDVQIAVDIFSFGTQKLFAIDQPNVSDENYFNIVLEKCGNFIESPRLDEDQVHEDDDINEEVDNSELDKLARLFSKFKPTTHSVANKHVVDDKGVEKVFGKNILSVDASKIFGLRTIGEREIITADFDENLIRLYLPPSSTGEPICIVCGETIFSNCSLVPIISPLYMRHCRLNAVDCCCNDVWLCFECRNNWVRDSLRLTMELAAVFDAPLKHGSNKPEERRSSLKKSKSNSSANRKILKSKQRIQRENWRAAAAGGGGGFLNYVADDSDCDDKTINEVTSHEYIVMNNFSSDTDFAMFDRMWRRHFFELMQPQYLPHNWSVEHDAVSCKKKDERKNHFLHKSVMFDDDIATIPTEKSTSKSTTNESKVMTNVKTVRFSRNSMVDMDDLFDYEECQMTKIMQQNTDDHTAFDPLGFGHHVKSKQFDRNLYKKLMQEGDVTLEKYMDERTRDDEPDDFDDMPLPPMPIMIVRGNGRGESRFRRPRYSMNSDSGIRRIHYVHPSNTAIKRPSENSPPSLMTYDYTMHPQQHSPIDFDHVPLQPMTIVRGKGERRLRRPHYSANCGSGMRRMNYSYPSNPIRRPPKNLPPRLMNSEYALQQAQQYSQHSPTNSMPIDDDLMYSPSVIMRGNTNGERRLFRRSRYSMNGSGMQRMH